MPPLWPFPSCDWPPPGDLVVDRPDGSSATHDVAIIDVDETLTLQQVSPGRVLIAWAGMDVQPLAGPPASGITALVAGAGLTVSYPLPGVAQLDAVADVDPPPAGISTGAVFSDGTGGILSTDRTTVAFNLADGFYGSAFPSGGGDIHSIMIGLGPYMGSGPRAFDSVVLAEVLGTFTTYFAGAHAGDVSAKWIQGQRISASGTTLTPVAYVAGGAGGDSGMVAAHGLAALGGSTGAGGLWLGDSTSAPPIDATATFVRVYNSGALPGTSVFTVDCLETGGGSTVFGSLLFDGETLKLQCHASPGGLLTELDDAAGSASGFTGSAAGLTFKAGWCTGAGGGGGLAPTSGGTWGAWGSAGTGPWVSGGTW